MLGFQVPTLICAGKLKKTKKGGFLYFRMDNASIIVFFIIILCYRSVVGTTLKTIQIKYTRYLQYLSIDVSRGAGAQSVTV